MTWGVTTLRDKWPNVNRLSTFKGVVLCIACRDIAHALKTDVEVVQSRLYDGDESRRPDFSKYEGLVVIEHPFMCDLTTGFTIAPKLPNWNQLQAVVSYDGPFKAWNLAGRRKGWRAQVAKSLANRCLKPDCPYDITEEMMLPSLMSEDLDGDVAEGKRQRKHHIVGDSHAFSIWQPDASIYGLQGKTLYRALQDGIENLIEGEPSHVSLNFGNTDLRHHFARQPEPLMAVKELAEEYARQARELRGDVTLYGLLPNIEDDSRFYKAYLYQDEWHAGSIELRDELRDCFNDVLFKSGLQVLMPPEAFSDDNGHLKRSIHELRGPHINAPYLQWCLMTDTQRDEYTWR